jgi:hypothetical protein
MNWEYLFIGIGFLAGAFILYKIRKIDYREDETAVINPMLGFNTWIMIIMCTVVGLVFICKSI